MDILSSIKKAFGMLPDLAGSIGQLVLYIVIIGLVVGVFIYQATTGGNINVDATSSSMIANQSTEFNTVVGTLWDAATSVTGFIVIGVIVIIAMGIFGKKLLGSKGGL